MNPPPPMIGLLLAGGHGRRAGGPKALKRLDGRLLWRVHADALHRAGCVRVVAVLHPSAMPSDGPDDEADPDEAGAGAEPRWLRCVAADPDGPMFASLQLGLQQIESAAAVLLQPVDAGRVLPATVAALRRGFDPDAAARVCVVRPKLGARTGHPLLLHPSACARLREADPAATRLDHWIAALHVERRRDVDVDDPEVLANYNRDGTGAGGNAGAAR
ncbi:MAG: NTP transferase domain-containing protein [Deltaproteobacteria bacterium]|nr:NTP transferase domain-containing protein [Deltaproteobacteria bacterium]